MRVAVLNRRRFTVEIKTWRQRLGKLAAICLAVCLLVVFCQPLRAGAGPQTDSAAAEKVRQEVERFRERDLLRVVFNDGSEKWGCLKETEADGFRFSVPNAPEEKVLYGDVATVKRGESSRQKILHGILRAATV